MTEIGDLEKLAAMRDSGVITAAEFEKKKREILKPKKKRRWWLRITLFCLGLLLFGVSFIVGRAASNIPTCDASAAKQAVANALQNNASAGIDTIRLLDWTDVRQISERKGERNVVVERQCSAVGMLNAGQRPLRYRFFFVNGKDGNWLVEVSAF